MSQLEQMDEIIDKYSLNANLLTVGEALRFLKLCQTYRKWPGTLETIERLYGTTLSDALRSSLALLKKEPPSCPATEPPSSTKFESTGKPTKK